MIASREHIKSHLFKILQDEKIFWSYENPNEIELSDEALIENVLIHLDKNEILLLFKIFPKEFIKQVWRKRLVPMETYYHTLNRYFALVFFGIKNPDRYYKRYSGGRVKEKNLEAFLCNKERYRADTNFNLLKPKYKISAEKIEQYFVQIFS